MSEPHGPLQGVRVVACSTAQAGTVPYMLMADLGAEVIKIEVPEGGDNSRGSTVLPGFPSTYFETNNRGVKSLTLNLKTEEGRDILKKLVARADIFGQNFRPGAAEKNGFGYDDLRRINPKLVYISISGYGPKGPNAHLPGTDSMAQALGGIAQAYATPGQPLKTGIVSVADETCAILAFGGALAALTYARATGIGQKVDCSLLGGQIRLMGLTLTTTMWRNRDPVTGQARITGTAQRPGLSASFVTFVSGFPTARNTGVFSRFATSAASFSSVISGTVNRCGFSAFWYLSQPSACTMPARIPSGFRRCQWSWNLQTTNPFFSIKSRFSFHTASFSSIPCGRSR